MWVKRISKVDGKRRRKWTPLGKFKRIIDGQERYVQYIKANQEYGEKKALFRNLEPDFWKYYVAHYSPTTSSTAESHWKSIKQEFGEDWIHLITAKKIEDFKASKTWSIPTWKIRLVLLKQFLAYAQRHGYLTTDPFKGIKIKQKRLSEYDPKAPNKEDVDTLLNYLYENQSTTRKKDKVLGKNYLVALFLAYTGMRPIELRRFKNESDIKDGKIRAEAKGRVRWIPIHPKLTPYLKELPIPHTKLGFKSALVRACRKLFNDESRITPYSFRHFFATELLRKTKNLRLVAQLMGHSDIQVTARYAWVLDGEQKEGVEMLD